MGVGKWPLILKLRHNIESCSGQIFGSCPSYCVTSLMWLWTWQKRPLRRVSPVWG